MLASKSCIYKMVKEEYIERKIHCLPRPFLLEATPYKDINFSSVTKECIRSMKLGINISKVIIVGDVAVGKTSLVNRFCHRIFETNYKATIGVDFEVEKFKIMDVFFNLQIWDTAGQERFKCIAQSYYRGANAVILVFSLTDPLTLKHTQMWLEESLKSNNNSPHIFLVGTKRDKLLPSSYITMESEAKTVAQCLDAEYWAVSSKTSDGVDHLFSRVAALSFDRAIQKESHFTMSQISIGNPLCLKQHLEKEKKQTVKCIKCTI